METLKTATGKEFPCDYFNPCPPVRQINVRVLNTPLMDIAQVFSDPAETVHMECDSVTADRYTKLKAIIPEGEATRVVLELEV